MAAVTARMCRQGEYLKLCGQPFWAFISGNNDLYTDIIEPLGHKAKEKNELFLNEYAKITNISTLEFLKDFCSPNGEILWKKLIAFNSGGAGQC